MSTEIELKKEFDKVFVLDTNIILNDSESIFQLSQENNNLIILPETVIDEMDSKKTGFDMINFQARAFGRILEEAQILQKTNYDNVQRVHLYAKDTYIDIISITDYSELGVDLNAERNILNDRKIIAVASFINGLYPNTPVTFLSNDIMARTRAISLGLDTEAVKSDVVQVHEFLKEIEVSDTLIGKLHLSDVRVIDPDYEYQNKCYLVKYSDGNADLAMVENSRLMIVDEKELDKQYVSPKNLEQKFFSYAIQHNSDLVVASANAGSGKTLVSLSNAMKLVKSKEYKKIVYLRSSVDSVDKTEEVGFLSGNDEKFAVYNHPIWDSLNYIARQEVKKRKEFREEDIVEKAEELKAKFKIETIWPGELRGRTISDAVVIWDEAQNTSVKAGALILSRLDESCKIIVLGSNKQIDNVYLNKHNNSLTRLLNLAHDENQDIDLFAIEMKKVLRGRLSKWTDEVFNKQ